MSRQASGLKAWLLQRITAVYLGLFVLFLAFHFLFRAPSDFASWRDWVAQTWVSVALLLFVVALLLHAWVGIRDILMDYIPALGWRLLLLSALAVGLTGSGLWAIRTILLAGV